MILATLLALFTAPTQEPCEPEFNPLYFCWTLPLGAPTCPEGSTLDWQCMEDKRAAAEALLYALNASHTSTLDFAAQMHQDELAACATNPSCDSTLIDCGYVVELAILAESYEGRVQALKASYLASLGGCCIPNGTAFGEVASEEELAYMGLAPQENCNLDFTGSYVETSFPPFSPICEPGYVLDQDCVDAANANFLSELSDLNAAQALLLSSLAQMYTTDVVACAQTPDCDPAQVSCDYLPTLNNYESDYTSELDALKARRLRVLQNCCKPI